MLQSISRDANWMDNVVSKSSVIGSGRPKCRKAADSKSAKPPNPLASRLAHVNINQAYHFANSRDEQDDIESSASHSEDDLNLKPTSTRTSAFHLPPEITKQDVQNAYQEYQWMRQQGFRDDDPELIKSRNLLQAVQQQLANARRNVNEVYRGKIIPENSIDGLIDVSAWATPPKKADPSAESMQQKIRVARQEAEALKLRIKQKKNELAGQSISEPELSPSVEDLDLTLKRDCGTIHYTISRSADWTDGLLRSGIDVSDSTSSESDSGEGFDDIPEPMRQYLALQAMESGKSLGREPLHRRGRMTERVMQKGV